MTNKTLEQRIAEKPYPKVTAEYINSRIKYVTYHGYSAMTICVLTLDNNFTVVGKSACADLRNYDEKIGQELALKDAKAQLWPLFGFLLSERILTSSLYQVDSTKEDSDRLSKLYPKDWP